jgi:iron-sulfur cluster repair protein YtfE (RIC family)
MAIPSGANETRHSSSAPPGRRTPEQHAIARVHRQHLEIVEHLRDLGAHLARMNGPLLPREVRNHIAGRLSQLQSELAEHFAEEELVGFVPHASALEPRLTHRARRVLSQHDLLRVKLAKVVSTLARGTADWGQVREGLEAFTALLLEHEERENELINEAHLDDLGGGS